jgi:hypothetical protein
MINYLELTIQTSVVCPKCKEVLDAEEIQRF